MLDERRAPQPNTEVAQRQAVGVLMSLGVTEAPNVSMPPAAANDIEIEADRPSRAARTDDDGPRRSWTLLSRHPWPLICVLLIQTALSARLAWSNTAFNDEALYLWAGHWEISHLLYGTKVPQFQTYFSGAPVLYPVVGAIADSYGGLAAARLLSLLFMLGTTTLLYLTGKRLYGNSAGVIGAGLFAVLGPVQFLGALATYDAMALFSLALSTWLVVMSRDRAIESMLLIPAALVLAIADASKYATALWDPVVFAIAALTASQPGWKHAAARTGRMAGYTIAFLALFMRLAGKSYIQGILFTTLARHASTAPVMAVLRDSALWIGILLLIAARSIVIAPGTRARLFAITLTAAAILAPLEQARIHTATALQKHVAFGAWFAAIAAGWVLADAIKRSKYSKGRIFTATLSAMALIGIVQATYLNEAWPNAKPVLAAIRRTMKTASGPILSEQGVVVDYYLNLNPTRLTNTFGFTYYDEADKRTLSGLPAYVAAIKGHYFSVIEIDGMFTRYLPEDNAIVAALDRDPHYQLVYTKAWEDHSSSGKYMVWEYRK